MRKVLLVLAAMAILLNGCNSKENKPNAVASDGTQISYDVSGQGEVALVLVHGWSCSKDFWKDQVPHFTKSYKVVTVDLAGHGLTGASREDYTIESFGGDVAAVIKTLGIKKAVLMGHSMGGPVVVEAARQLPGPVLGVIGVDTLHDLEKGYQDPGVDKILENLKKDFPTQTALFVRQMFTADADPAVVEWVIAEMKSADPKVGLSAMKNLANYDLKSAVQQLKIPVYSINADLWPTNLEANKKVVPSYKLKIMSGLGHFIMLEDPKGFNKLLDETIQEIAGSQRK